MYLEKDKAERRLDVANSQLNLLYQQERFLKDQISKLESEKKMLHELLKIYEIEARENARK